MKGLALALWATLPAVLSLQLPAQRPYSANSVNTPLSAGAGEYTILESAHQPVSPRPSTFLAA